MLNAMAMGHAPTDAVERGLTRDTPTWVSDEATELGFGHAAGVLPDGAMELCAPVGYPFRAAP